MTNGEMGVPKELREWLRSFNQVEAVAVGGSQSANMSDQSSDVDIYVYTRSAIDARQRARWIEPRAARMELDNHFFEPGDEWTDKQSGVHYDVMYREVSWIAEQFDRVLERFEASVGYTTCFIYNVDRAQALFDRNGWFAELQARAHGPFPEKLRNAIVSKNFPLLAENLSSYAHQLDVAARRGDSVSINHRVSAFLASWFDVVFALNRQWNPGEKRLLDRMEQTCELFPPFAIQQLTELIHAAGDDSSACGPLARLLAAELEPLLRAEQLL